MSSHSQRRASPAQRPATPAPVSPTPQPLTTALGDTDGLDRGAATETPTLDRARTAAAPPTLPEAPDRDTHSDEITAGRYDLSTRHEGDPSTVTRARGVDGRSRATWNRATSRETERVDVRATAQELVGALSRRADELDTQLTTTADPTEHARMRAEVARLRGDAIAVAAAPEGPDGEATLARAARDHAVPVTPRYVTTRDDDARATGWLGNGVGRRTERRTTTAAPSAAPLVSGHDVTDRTERTTTALTTAGIQRDHAVTTERRNGDGTGQTTTDRTQTGAQLFGVAGAGIGRQRDHGTTRTDADGSSATETASSARGVGWRNGGIDYATRTQSGSSTRGADGEETSRSSAATSRSGGLILTGDDGPGLRTASSTSAERRTTEGASRVAATTDASITANGARANSNATAAASAGPVRAEGTVGGGGGYTVHVNPVPDTAPPEYEVVLALTFNANLGGTASAGSSDTLGSSSPVSGSVGVTASASRGLTYRHRMTNEASQAYVAQLRTASRGGTLASGSPPEFGVMERMFAAGNHAGGLSATEVLSSPADASRMAVGSSLEYASTTNVGVNASVSAEGGGASVGANGSAAHGQTRSVRVGRVDEDGQPRVEIVLSFSDEETRSIGANARAGVAGGEASRETSASRGNTATFHLDPNARDYDAQFRRVMGANDPSAAARLARELGAERTETSSTSVNTAISATGGEGNLSAGLTQTDRRSEQRQVTFGAVDAAGHRELSAEDSATSEQSLGVNVAGRNVARAADNTTATSQVDANGQQRVNVVNTRTTSAPVAPGWLAGLLGTTETEMSAYRLNSHDVDVLAGRARDRSRWLNVLPGGLIAHVRQPWLDLAASLARPAPEPAWVEANPEIANRIARGRAILAFVRAVDASDGIEATGHALRDWDAGGEQLGEHLEFPEAISAQRTAYDALHARVVGAHDRYDDVTGAARSEAIQADIRDITTRLRAVLVAVTACQTYRNSGAKIETIAAIQNDLDAMTSLATQYAATPTTRDTPGAARPAAQQAQQTPATATSHTPPPAPTHDRALHRIQTVIPLLESCKTEEGRHTRAAQSRAAAYDGLFGARADITAAIGELDAIDTLFPMWKTLWDELERLFTETHQSPRELPWSLRPNVRWRTQLLTEAVERLPASSRGWYDVSGRTARWQAQAGRWAM
jgi:hypothetical protein